MNEFMTFVGGRVVEISDEHAIAEVEVTDHVRQQTGAVHASVMIAIADLAASSLAGRASGASGPLAIDIHASLVANQTSGTIRAEARFIRHGRRVSMVRTLVTGDEGRTLAQVTVTLVPAVAPDRESQGR